MPLMSCLRMNTPQDVTTCHRPRETESLRRNWSETFSNVRYVGCLYVSIVPWRHVCTGVTCLFFPDVSWAHVFCAAVVIASATTCSVQSTVLQNLWYTYFSIPCVLSEKCEAFRSVPIQFCGRHNKCCPSQVVNISSL